MATISPRLAHLSGRVDPRDAGLTHDALEEWLEADNDLAGIEEGGEFESLRAGYWPDELLGEFVTGVD